MKRILPYGFASLVVWAAMSLLQCPSARGQDMTHTVESGDTLWDLCEKYYGDSSLWPKLWQMNPFVTNPHLLKPGDVIRLLTGVPTKPAAPVEIKSAMPAEASDASRPEEKGIDISGLTTVRSMGMFSTEKVLPWGRLFSPEEEKILLSKGSAVFLELAAGREVRPGDSFVVYRVSSLLKNPVNRAGIGYVVTFLGRVAVREHVEKRVYKGEIVETYRDVRVGDTFLPYEPVSSCVEIVPGERPLDATIVAAEEEKAIIGPRSVVYLPVGLNQDVKRGRLFEIVKKRKAKASERPGPKEIALPELPIGRLLILESRRDTATGVVVELEEHVAPGISVRSVTKSDIPRALAVSPKCSR